MLKIDIPGGKKLELHSLLLDYNGTVACDGALVPGAAERLQKLAELLDVKVLTADTYGTVKAQCAGLPVQVCTFPQGDAGPAKARIAQDCGAGVVALGNGFNDIQLLDAADFSIAVLDAEGMCAALLPHADILSRSVTDALDLLLCTDRIRADLRS